MAKTTLTQRIEHLQEKLEEALQQRDYHYSMWREEDKKNTNIEAKLSLANNKIKDLEETIHFHITNAARWRGRAEALAKVQDITFDEPVVRDNRNHMMYKDTNYDQ